MTDRAHKGRWRKGGGGRGGHSQRRKQPSQLPLKVQDENKAAVGGLLDKQRAE